MKEVILRLPSRVIYVKIDLIESGRYKGYVNTERFRPTKYKSSTLTGIQAYTEETEFLSDIEFLVERINSKGSMTPYNLTQSLRESCIRHINKIGRLIIVDLYTYVDCCLHVLSAYDMGINFNDATQEMYSHYVDKMIAEFKDYIYVHKPWGLVKYQ